MIMLFKLLFLGIFSRYDVFLLNYFKHVNITNIMGFFNNLFRKSKNDVYICCEPVLFFKTYSALQVVMM